MMTRVAVQGFGNVGSAVTELCQLAGARIVAVQDHTGTVWREAGLDFADLTRHVHHTGGVAGLPGAEALEAEAFWDVPCDILIPAALEGQITAERAGRVATDAAAHGHLGRGLRAHPQRARRARAVSISQRARGGRAVAVRRRRTQVRARDRPAGAGLGAWKLLSAKPASPAPGRSLRGRSPAASRRAATRPGPGECRA